ncbi:MAG TPA: hypothetical protein VEI81_05560 [Methanoregula sp.]|nr:hypothetical protein [Methanoregula sp.]
MDSYNASIDIGFPQEIKRSPDPVFKNGKRCGRIRKGKRAWVRVPGNLFSCPTGIKFIPAYIYQEYNAHSFARRDKDSP